MLKRSSLAPKPPPVGLLVFDCCGGGGLETGGDTGAALLHPPKSSSAVIFGTVCDPKLPFGVEPPAQAKSFEGLDKGGDFTAGAFIVAGVGSGVAQASFEPHASVSLNPENALLVLDAAMGVDLGCGFAGAERLNAELRLIEGFEVF